MEVEENDACHKCIAYNDRESCSFQLDRLIASAPIPASRMVHGKCPVRSNRKGYENKAESNVIGCK